MTGRLAVLAVASGGFNGRCHKTLNQSLPAGTKVAKGYTVSSTACVRKRSSTPRRQQPG